MRPEARKFIQNCIPLRPGPAYLKIFGGGTMPKRLGGEALLAPGRLGGEPYPLGAGLKIFDGAHRPHFEACRVGPQGDRE